MIGKSKSAPKITAKKPAAIKEFPISVEYAKTGKSKCVAQNCGDPRIEAGELRVGISKKWHHLDCLTSNLVGSALAENISGFEKLEDQDQQELENVFSSMSLVTPPCSDSDSEPIATKAPKKVRKAAATPKVGTRKSTRK